jgi:contractile injection system tube protein
MGFSGGLEKMKIMAFKDASFTVFVDELSVYMNPEKYSHSYKVCYNKVQAQGANGSLFTFNQIGTETVEFELVFDGTGVIPSKIPGVLPFTEDGITKQIEKFKLLVFAFQGSIHSPYYLKISWGQLLFQCRLSKLNFNYTLFKPDGTPLRARAHAVFIGFNDEKTLALKANKSSPDLSHVRTVKAGDTLPLMCFDIYGSSAQYLQVARVNGLNDFRNLTVGSQLLFPPLGEATT